MSLQIRSEETEDLERIRDVVRSAFPTDVESRLVDALRANGKAVTSLVAVYHNRLVGHILFSAVTTTPFHRAKGVGLAPVAVHPDVQSQGIGSLLIREGLHLCSQRRYDYCVVLGAPSYYQRFGFENAATRGLLNEYGVDHEFMVIHFSNCKPGLVKYASEFGRLSV